MCMKEFIAKIYIFLTNLQHFELSQFSSNAHIDLWVIVHTLRNQLLLELSVYSFETWQVLPKNINLRLVTSI